MIVGRGKDNTVYHYQLDHIGTPLDLTNTEGKAVWSAQYLAYGTIYTQHTEEVTNPLRFQGQYFDQETGLHYNRHRYYNPKSGLFTTADPIGLAGGLNNYQYVKNPTGFVDPLGLADVPMVGGGCGGKSDTSTPETPNEVKIPSTKEEANYLYRGVHANHPALGDAKKGNVVPGNVDGTVTPEMHNAGGYASDSPFTSWTRDVTIATQHAAKHGEGGVVLRVSQGAPTKGEQWRWTWSPDIYGEQEILMLGIRKNVEVLK